MLMPNIVPHSVHQAQPHSVWEPFYRLPIMESDPKKFLWKNICSLMPGPGGKDPSIDDVTKKTKVGRGTIQRIKEGNTSCGLDVVTKLATAFGIDPWQLLVPNIDPNRLPRLDNETFRWPFRNVDMEMITGLVGSPAVAVENGLLVALAAAGISPRKRTGTLG